MILYYVRHGDPIYDPDSLTPLGRRQAEAVGRRLALRGLDRIYASTSERAILTATPTAELLNKPITTLDWCNEAHTARAMMDTDPVKGIRTWCFNIDRYRRLFNIPEVRALGMAWHTHEAFDDRFGEEVGRVSQACDALLEQHGYRHDRTRCLYEPIAHTDERIALFAHQGFGFLFLSVLLDIPYPLLATHTDITRSSVSVIECIPRDGIVIPRMITMANDGHLYGEHLPSYI